MIAERLSVRRLLEDEMKPAARCCCDRPWRQTTVLRYKPVERRNTIGPAVSVGIDRHQTSAAERDTRDGSRMRTPPPAHALRVGAPELPSGYDRFFLPSAVFPIDAGRKYRNAGFGQIKCGLEIARLDVGRGCSVERKRRL